MPCTSSKIHETWCSTMFAGGLLQGGFKPFPSNKTAQMLTKKKETLYPVHVDLSDKALWTNWVKRSATLVLASSLMYIAFMAFSSNSRGITTSPECSFPYSKLCWTSTNECWKKYARAGNAMRSFLELNLKNISLRSFLWGPLPCLATLILRRWSAGEQNGGTWLPMTANTSCQRSTMWSSEILRR